ncbi:hypothetical protein F4802DRAFT_482233 [Xylaria palmicola]|nr:hypothetical protein F4802DRAFT_482233 [Xylaria palmicola]
MHTTQISFSLGILLSSTMLATAAPQRPPVPSVTTKRDTWNYPMIGQGIDTSDPSKGSKLLPRPDLETSGAFNNAYQMLEYATRTADSDSNKVIFQKYFDAGDKQLVMDLFKRILGDGSGAPAMTDIIVGAGNDDEESPAPAELVNYDGPQPTILITEDAWVYPDRDAYADACQMWDEEGITQDMYLLGSVLLHEYMHWDWFLGSIHQGEIIDQMNGYGWENARALDKGLAIYNADSYGWYATELLWAIICEKDMGYESINRGLHLNSAATSKGLFYYDGRFQSRRTRRLPGQEL